jgi:hypothetical protein
MRKLAGLLLAAALMLTTVGSVASSTRTQAVLFPQIEQGLSHFSLSEREIMEEYILGNLKLGQLNERCVLDLLGAILQLSSGKRRAVVEGYFKFLIPPYTPHEEVMLWEFPSGFDIDAYMEKCPSKCPLPLHSMLVISAPFTGYIGTLISVGAPPTISWVAEFILRIGGKLRYMSKVKLGEIIYDNRDDPTLALSHLEMVKAQKPHPPLILLDYGPEAAPVAAPFLEENGMMNLATGSVTVRTNYLLGKNNIGVQACREEMLSDIVRYLMMERPKETGEKPPQKIGAITWDLPTMIDVFDRLHKTTFFKQMEKEYGLEWVGTQKFGIATADVTSQLMKLRDDGAEIILGASYSQGTAVVAKCAKLLGMGPQGKCKCDFVWWSYGLDWSASNMAGKDTIEGWFTSYPANSYDEPGARGNFIYDFLEDYTGVELTMPSACSVGGGVSVLQAGGPLIFAGEIVDKYAPLYGYDVSKMLHKMNVDWYLERIFSWNNHWHAWMPIRPYTFIPGKWTATDNLICVERDGCALHVRHRDDRMWSWVPPKIIPEDGPQPPEGWIAPPLEGSIDYGGHWGEWTFDEFLAQYDVPLWWVIFAYAFGPNNRLDKDLLFKTLDRYFECKKVIITKEYYDGFTQVNWNSPEKKVKKLCKFKEMYYLPQNWIEWIDDYVAKI